MNNNHCECGHSLQVHGHSGECGVYKCGCLDYKVSAFAGVGKLEVTSNEN